MAADMDVPFLGKVPLDPRIGRCCDEGKSFLSEVPESPATAAYKQIIRSMLRFVFMHHESLFFSHIHVLREFYGRCQQQ